jgi:hypothetical protein
MYKLLPILLVVVLSGCSSGPKEYSCKTNQGELLYLMINKKEMILDIGTNRGVAKITRSDDISIYAKLNNAKEKKSNNYGRVAFNKKLKTFSFKHINKLYIAKCEKI